MYSKTIIYIGVFIGSSIGGLIPMLWGADLFSFSAVIFTAIGGILGIWGAIKFSDYVGL